MSERIGQVSKNSLRNLDGTFTSYRKSNEPAKVIVGKYRFESTSYGALFWHSSVQTIQFSDAARETKTYHHEGIVVGMKGRLFLLGLGPGYMRPEILLPVGSLDNWNAFHGILLTEKEEINNTFSPLASKTLIVRDGLRENRDYLDDIVVLYLQSFNCGWEYIRRREQECTDRFPTRRTKWSCHASQKKSREVRISALLRGPLDTTHAAFAGAGKPG